MPGASELAPDTAVFAPLSCSPAERASLPDRQRPRSDFFALIHPPGDGRIGGAVGALVVVVVIDDPDDAQDSHTPQGDSGVQLL